MPEINDQPKTPVRIAVVGAGSIGPRHAASVRKNASAQLTCFVEPGPGAQAAADSFGVPVLHSVDDLIASPDLKPDAAIVCTPNHTHVKIAHLLLSHGIHVLLEKPLSESAADGESLVNHARTRNAKLLVGHHRRFNSYVVATKRALEQDIIGKVVAVNGLWMTCKPLSYYEHPTEWRALASSGGVVRINLVHDIDILQHLFGPIRRVFAEKSQNRRKHEAEEGAAIVLRFASGIIGTFLLCDSTPSGHNFESGTGENPMIPQSGTDFYRIFGTEGTLSVPDMTVSKASNWSEPLRQERLGVVEVIPFDLQLAHFIRVVRGVEQPSCSGEEGLRAVRVCEAVAVALKTGQPVDIPV